MQLFYSRSLKKVWAKINEESLKYILTTPMKPISIFRGYVFSNDDCISRILHWRCWIFFNAWKNTSKNHKINNHQVSTSQKLKCEMLLTNSCTFLCDFFLLTSKIMHVPNCQQLWIGGRVNMTSTFFSVTKWSFRALLHLAFDL